MAISTTVNGVTSPEWVRVTRSGDVFTGSYSADGLTWTQIGTPVSYTAPAMMYDGLIVTSFTQTQVSTATFTNVTQVGGPTVASPANADPSPVAATSTVLSALGADSGAESNLLYTWTVTAQPAGATSPVFTLNGSNAAKNTTATFYQPGEYTFLVTITNGVGLSTTSSVSVTVIPTLTTIQVSPASSNLNQNQSQTFTATAYDQFARGLQFNRASPGRSAPVLAWSTHRACSRAGRRQGT
ncbi:MAG: hypothetical protein U0794_16210 [Isosphaeraceae bacterium]